jgi:hypothetical protein
MDTLTRKKLSEKYYKHAVEMTPLDSSRVERRETQEHRAGRPSRKGGLFYVFLCKECHEREIRYPCYYLANKEKYAALLTYRCRRCSNGHNWDKKTRDFESKYNRLVDTAKRRGIPCCITYEHFLLFTNVEKCHYCGSPLKWPRRGITKGVGHNLDRKDSSQGYSPENCVVSCGECNRIKSSKYSYEQMLLIGQALRTCRESGHGE